jgi:uncharacterized membrane protein
MTIIMTPKQIFIYKQSSWEKYEDETMNRKGYTRASGKWTKVSEEFKPHYEESKSRKLLNLDCVRNPEEILERWSKDMIMLLEMLLLLILVWLLCGYGNV